MKTKVIVIFGGVYSSLGKGIIASSVGNILKHNGYSVFMQKMDPYLNVDPGTLSPYQHGEVFVTNDGKECDLDLGNYERFINADLTANSSITSGYIYNKVITDERKGLYEGRTVQVVPHITSKIKEHITKTINDEKPDFLIIEVGGTVGDIESIPFIESISQYASEYGKDNFLSILCAPLISLDGSSGEVKTKPAQHSIREMGALNIVPSLLVLRSTKKVDSSVINKICLNCHLDSDNVFISYDLSSIYKLPNELYNQKIHEAIFKYFSIENNRQDNFSKWINFTDTIKTYDKKVRIALVGKYTELKDAYMSVHESLNFACYKQGLNLEIDWINSTNVNESNVENLLKQCDGILVPGGFGHRGVEGKILAAKYARENNVPYFGICFGLQLALIEFAKNVLGIKNPNSTELDKSCFPIFDYIDGNMHLGQEDVEIVPNTLTHKIYESINVKQRFRHRYEFNNSLIKQFEDKGIVFSGFCNHKSKTVCCFENTNNDFFFACQYHPEFISKPNTPEKSFVAFITAAFKHKRN